MNRDELIERLERGGFVAAEEEADELLETAAGDERRLAAMLARRLEGEPLAWIIGWTRFCGVRVTVRPGVYVPRWQTEALAERAAAALPDGGLAVDLCCGSGAVGAVLRARRPGARVVGVDVDPMAVACARENGVEAVVGDLAVPVTGADVVAGVVPYVPTDELRLLQRDTFAWETPLSYDGGPDGCALLRRAVAGARGWLRPGGVLLLELGGDQAGRLSFDGFEAVEVWCDELGDVRGVAATRRASPAR